MVQLWHAWWSGIESLNMFGGLAWAFWVLGVLPASDTRRSPSFVTPSDQRWLRTLGWASVVSGPRLPETQGGDANWRRYCEKHEQSARMAEHANRTRFVVPMALAYVVLITGFLQLVLTPVYLLPAAPEWMLVSIAIALLSYAPAIVTSTLQNRRWRARQTFEWRLFEQVVRVQRELGAKRMASSDHRVSVLDRIERVLVERFSRMPLDLSSEVTRAERWQTALSPVIDARPKLQDSATAIEDARRWIDRSSKLALSRWETRPARRWFRPAPPPLVRRPAFKEGAGLRTIWGGIFLYVNLFIAVAAMPGDKLVPAGARISDFVRDLGASGFTNLITVIIAVGTLISASIKRWISSST